MRKLGAQVSFVLLNGLLLQVTYTICTTRSVNVCIERPLHTEKHSAMPSLNERLDFVSFAFGAAVASARAVGGPAGVT